MACTRPLLIWSVANAATYFAPFSTALAQCPQAWIENGGLPSTTSGGVVTRAAILSTHGHEYAFASGTFNFVNEQPILNFVVFDNQAARSPFSLPGWEHVSGTVSDIKEFEGRVYFAGQFNVDGLASIPLISWDGARVESFAPLENRGKLVCIASVGGQRVVHLVTQIAGGQPPYMRLDGNTWTGFYNSSMSSAIALEVLDDVPGGSLIALSSGGRLSLVNGSTFQDFPNLVLSGPGQRIRAIRAEGQGADATLYAGGDISYINGIAIKNIGMYRGGVWSSLGAGVASEVFSIARTGASGQSELAIGTRLGDAIPNSTYRARAKVLVLRGGGWQTILTAPTAGGNVLRTATLLVGGESHLLVAGPYTDEIATGVATALGEWDGNSWSPLPQSIGSGGVIGAIEKLDTGDGPAIYAAGNFRTTDRRLQSIARFDGEQWQPVGDGLPVGSFEGANVLGVARTGAGARLIVGGRGDSGFYIKSFDGATWLDMKAGINIGYSVNQFFDYDDGTGPHTYTVVKLGTPPLYKLEDTTWHPVSGGATAYSSYPYAATTFDNGDGESIYIGYSGGNSRIVQRWSPSTGLQNFDIGLPSPTVLTSGATSFIKLPDGESTRLLVGGDFYPYDAQHPGARYLAQLNGNTWEQFVPVPPSPVADMAMHDFGSGPVLTAILYDRTYTDATKFTPYRLVDGAWEQFGAFIFTSGLISAHFSAAGVLRDIDGTLFVGGMISSVNGLNSNLIARFGPGHCFCSADFNQDGSADLFDYLDFVAAFAAGSPMADVNQDEVIDLFDYLDFLQTFTSGC